MRRVLVGWVAGKTGITLGRIYDIHEVTGDFLDDTDSPRDSRYGEWAEPDISNEECDATFNETTFAPLETNDAGETNLNVDDTLQQRGTRYGSFSRHAEISQKLLDAALTHANEEGIELDHVHTEALSMIFHKIGRIVNGDPNYYDSWKDIAGYATLAEQWVTEGRTA